MRRAWVFWIGIGMVAAGLAASEYLFSVGGAKRAEGGIQVSELRTAEGSIAELDMSAPLPVVKVSPSGGDGRLLELTIDPLSTVVLQDRRVTTVAQLERGQRVKVGYQRKEGREVANAIEITDPLPMPAAADGAPPAQGAAY